MNIIIKTLSDEAEEILGTNVEELDIDVKHIHDLDNLIDEVQDYFRTKTSNVYLKYGRDWTFKNEREVIDYLVSEMF